MPQAQFADSEFLSAAVLNAAMSVVSGAVALTGALHTPGLIGAANLTFTPSALTVQVTTPPAGFAVAFGSGLIANGNGTTDGTTSDVYTVNFAPLVPGSGSVTAYMLAAYTTIQAGPYQVVGPPPGHPDYDPTFNPYTAYSELLGSLVITASTTPPNGVTTFELCRVTLSAGQVSIPSVVTTYQQRAGALLSQNGEVLAADLAAGAAIANIGYTPVQQGGGASQLPGNKVYIGWDGTFPRIQINSTDFGEIALTNWVNAYFATIAYVEDNYVADSTFNAYINQPVKTTNSPTFANINLTGLGYLYGGILNQAVLTDSTPEFYSINLLSSTATLGNSLYAAGQIQAFSGVAVGNSADPGAQTFNLMYDGGQSNMVLRTGVYPNLVYWQFNSTGDAYAVYGDWVNASSAALKDNIQTVPDALATVRKLTGRSFVRKTSGLPGMGVIAEELEPVLPDLVRRTVHQKAAPLMKGTDPATGLPTWTFGQREEGEPVLGVAYDGFVAVFIEAIKELADIIDGLRATLTKHGIEA